MADDELIQKVRKLLSLAENNNNEHEAISAAGKAQQLMAKYHLEYKDILEEVKEDIVEMSYHAGTGNKWKYQLAGIVAKNFRCHVYYVGKRNIVFYGYETDAIIARETFKYLFEQGLKFVNHLLYKKHVYGLSTKDVKNTYLVGYLNGIKSVLDKQCTALMIITPLEVNEKFEEISKDMGGINTSLTFVGNNKDYYDGYEAGVTTANSRSIETEF